MSTPVTQGYRAWRDAKKAEAQSRRPKWKEAKAALEEQQKKAQAQMRIPTWEEAKALAAAKEAEAGQQKEKKTKS